MSSIEIIIVLLLLFMAVPDLCRKLGRPALAYSVFVLLGVGLGPWANAEVGAMLRQAGQVGFLLLLFEVGLEIDPPPWRSFFWSLSYATAWAVWQYPFVLAVMTVAGMSWGEAAVAAAALTGCSVGMAHPAWKSYPGLTERLRAELLWIMVALEMLTIVLLAGWVPILDNGFGWTVGIKLLTLGVVIFTIARFGVRLVPLFERILEMTTHWRVHWLVLLLLVVCALGERLGLDAAKTAFFLGLALNRTRHRGEELEQLMAPVSHGFLIPVFFVSLGLKIDVSLLVSWSGLLAFGLAGLLLGVRLALHRRWLPSGGDANAYLLFCPNLTMAALAANVLWERSASSAAAPWLLLVGLFVTVLAIAFLPSERLVQGPSLPMGLDAGSQYRAQKNK